MASVYTAEEAFRRTCEIWGKQELHRSLYVSTSGFQCKIDFFEDRRCPKITCYPWRIIGYVLEKLGIAISIDVTIKDEKYNDNNAVIYINPKNLIEWRNSIKEETCKKEYQIDQIFCVDRVLTGKGWGKQILK